MIETRLILVQKGSNFLHGVKISMTQKAQRILAKMSELEVKGNERRWRDHC